LTTDELSLIAPVQCDEGLVKILGEEAEALSLKSMHMPSGAAHDAQILGGMTRMGMIFAPSRGGKSHSPEEWTAWEDVEAASNLALRALLRLGLAE